MLGAELLETVLKALTPLIDRSTEFTVEANPGVLDSQLGQLLAENGVNRVNLGAQSFQASELQVLGRIHTPSQVREALGVLVASGIRNVGLDLMYGIPTQSLSSWRSSLNEALDLPIRHLSCYALSFEPGTDLYRDLSTAGVCEMHPELQRECYYTAIDIAGQAGLQHYEISNFARQDSRCRHNLTYWRNRPYLGIGPAASSYIGGVRRTNIRDIQAYTDALLGRPASKIPLESSERLGHRAVMAETLMLGLRLIEGVDRHQFARRFGEDPLKGFERSIRRYEQLAALVVTPSDIRLASESLFVSDTILAEILAEA